MNNSLTLKTQKESKIITEMFLALLPAQVLSAAVASFSSIINGLVIGNCLSSDAMVALGFVTPITLILGAISAIISGGAKVLFGRYIGRGDRDKLNEIFSVSIVSAIIVGAALSLIGLLFSRQIAFILGARDIYIVKTAQYIDGLAIGILPTILCPLLLIMLQLTERANYAFCSTLVLAGSNLLFSLINVKLLNGDIFEMGLATTASQYITAAFLIIRFCMKDSELKFDYKKFSVKFASSICVLGSPAALCVIFYGVRNIIINNIAFSTAGDVAVSALAIVGSAIGPIDAINTGVGSVGIILTALYIGEKDIAALNKLYFVFLRIGLTISVCQIIFIAALGRPLCALFGAEGETLTQAYHLFLGFVATKIPYTITLASVSMMQSMGRIKRANIYFFFVALVSPVVTAKLFGSLFGITGVWMCYVPAEIVGIIIIYIWHARKQVGNENYVQSSGKQLSITINSVDQMVNVSEKIISFCNECGIEKRRSNLSGLCLEEIGTSIIAQGFDEKNYIDFHINVEDDEITLRLRNNARRNNPFESFSSYDPKDPAKNIGVRMVQQIAKEITYQPTFGMNVLIIKL